jgi:D-alanine--poly(phosphoribitol) ligase subunit 2
MKDKVQALIVQALREVSEQQAIAVPGDVGAETSLFGRNGLLDSLGLVSLVIAVEQLIEDELGVSVSLANEKAMSQKQSPYRTVGTLAQYASEILPTVG